MKIDRAGYPFVAGALAPALLLAVARRPRLSIPFLALAGAFTFFFRDPERAHPDTPGDVLAPADGRVVVAGDVEAGVAPDGEWTQVSVFLSPLDVHVNRIPIGGRVLRVDYRAGRYRPAYQREASSENERNEIWIERPNGELVVLRQIAGVLVRRVVCRVVAGEAVAAGQRFGVMKFGSRADLFLPSRARLAVQPGDRVRAGETVVATL